MHILHVPLFTCHRTRPVRNSRDNIAIYQTNPWKLERTVKVVPGVTSLCVFGNGRLVVVGSISAGLISVINERTGAVIHRFSGFEQSPYGSLSLGALAGSPSGDLILAGIAGVTLSGKYIAAPEQRKWARSIDGRAVRLFRVIDGTEIASFGQAKTPIRQATWDPKGRYVAFIDHADGLFLWWAPWKAEDYRRIDVPDLTLSLAISPDGNRIAVTTARGVSVYSITSRSNFEKNTGGSRKAIPSAIKGDRRITS